MPSSPRVLLFDLYHQGHHSAYFRTVLAHWLRLDPPGSLDLVVSREMAERVPELAEMARSHPHVTLHTVEIPGGLRARTGSRAVLSNDVRIGRYLREAVERLRPDHVLAMYLDHLQASLAAGLRFQHRVRLSGIYFRPAFHYRAMGRGPGTARARADDLLKRALLRLALANPHVDTVFTLDPYAVGPVQALAPRRVRVVALPEAVEASVASDEAPEATRRRLGVEDGRVVLLLFGSLDPRKGVRELLAALALLPEALARRACLVMAGEATGDAASVAAGVAALRARGAVQVVYADGFVSDAEMHRLFGVADLAVLPYQRHVGSSGVLVRAAAAGVPVLGPAYGMLGARIDEVRLGASADTSDPADLARGLARFLGPHTAFPFDAAAARAFAAANTEHAMATALLSPLYDSQRPSC